MSPPRRGGGGPGPPAEAGSLGFLKKPRAPFFKKEPRLLKKAWAPPAKPGSLGPRGGAGPLFL